MTPEAAGSGSFGVSGAGLADVLSISFSFETGFAEWTIGRSGIGCCAVGTNLRPMERDGLGTERTGVSVSGDAG